MRVEMAYTEFKDLRNNHLQDLLDTYIWPNIPTVPEHEFQIGLYNALEEIVGKATKLPESISGNKKGGCFFWIRKRDDEDFYISPKMFGENLAPDPEYGVKNDKYIVYSFSKAALLVQNQADLTSFQNKSLPKEEQLFIGKDAVPEGAIALPNGIIFSFSGFAGYIDEAICLALAWKMRLMNEEQAIIISEKSTGKSYEIARQLISDTL